jgi:hypothetical protein
MVLVSTASLSRNKKDPRGKLVLATRVVLFK